MFLQQYFLGCLAHASYLVGDKEAGKAVVIDPQRDIGRYLDEASSLGLTITHVILTHLHADFVAGHVEMRDAVGAVIGMSSKAELEFDFHAFEDGEILHVGDVQLQFLHTPGHTPESMSIVAYDGNADTDKPFALFSGDTLFIGDVGRPDLLASIGWTADDLASMLYDSLHDKLLPLPDETLLYPAHGAGSLCGKKLSNETVSTIGEQRQYNYALQPMPKETFISIVTADQPKTPDYFIHDAVLNSKERPNLTASLKSSLTPLTLDELLSMADSGTQILDVREPIDYEGGHLRGSLNVGLSGTFATWVGSFIKPDAPVAIIAGPGQEEEAAIRLGRIGFDRMVGYLDGGMMALENRPDLVVRTERITAPTVAEHLLEEAAPMIVDIRTVSEWSESHIDGSLNIPLSELPERLPEIPRDRAIVIHCASGYRSAIGSSLLERAGLGHFSVMVGGIDAWRASNLDTVTV